MSLPGWSGTDYGDGFDQMKNIIRAYPAMPFIAPFAVFIVLLGLKGVIPLGINWQYPIQVLFVSAVLLVTSRGLIKERPQNVVGSVFVGLAVFVVWVGPDLIWPSYRHHWLFENSVTGVARSSLPIAYRSNLTFLIFRLVGTAVLVPIIEEVFWRGWLMRYLINIDFFKVPLGTYSRNAYWLTAIMFAVEHGPFWDVGLMAGLMYNSWMIRTRKLSDCIIAHSITNLALACFVLFSDHWEYWL